MPNPNTLDWIYCQDIQISDVNLQQQYWQYFQNGQYTEALTLLSNNATQLEGKAFIANLCNVVATGITKVENDYNNAVPLFLSNLSAQYFSLINNFINKEIWNGDNEYKPYNFVLYNDDIYLCIAPAPVGTLPTDTNYWILLGLRGKTGAPGIDVNMRYQWNNTNTYNINDLVVYGTTIYVALVQNTGVTPGTDETIWGVFLISTPGEIYIGTSAPENPIQNMIWFETTTNPLEQSTVTPLIGQFYLYNSTINNWEEMYPNMLFRWLDGYDNYVSFISYIDLNIQPNQWINQSYTYSYPFLNANSLVYILPAEDINENQYVVYNSLTLTLSGNNIILSTNLIPTVDLPLIIQIQ